MSAEAEGARAKFRAARLAWITENEAGVPQPTKAWARFVRALASAPPAP